MKKLFLIPLILLQIGIFFPSCKEKIVENIPTVVSLTATPQSVVYGSKITVTADVKDNAVALYSAKLIYSVGGVEVKRDTILLKGQSETITKDFQLDLYRNAPDNGTLKITLELTNSEGGVATQSIDNIVITRPVFDKLYLKLEDSTVLEMTRRITDPNVYECAWTLTNDVKVQVLSNATTPASGLVWGDVAGAFDLSKAATPAFFELIDPLMLPTKITFNVMTFDLQFEGATINDGKTYVGMAQMNYETGLDATKFTGYKVMRGTGHFNNNGQVFFRNLPAGVVVDSILNPDFFTKRDGKYYFIGESGDYMIRYDQTVGYLFVYPTQPAFPNGLFIAGYGYGCPSATYDSQFYSDYNWDDETLPPGVYYYMPKIAANIYQCTVYLHVDVTDFIGFNFYYQKGWGDAPTGSGPGGIGQITADQVASCNLESFAFASGGVWRDVSADANLSKYPFTNGIYTLQIDLAQRKLTATLVKAKN
ncbi:MAG: hypothetical protein WC542_15270 [Paludibacter sp.]